MRRRSLCLLLLLLLVPTSLRAADTVRLTHEYLPVTKDGSLHMDQFWFYGTHEYFSYALRTNKDDGVDTLTIMPGTPPLTYGNGDLRLSTWLTAGTVLSTNYHLEPISVTGEWNALAVFGELSLLNIFQGRIGLHDRSHKTGGTRLGNAPDTWIETVILDFAMLDELSVGMMWRFTIKVPDKGDTDPWHTIGPSITWRFSDPLFFSAWPYLANVSDSWEPGIAISIGLRMTP